MSVTTSMTFTRHPDVAGVLADTRFAVPAVAGNAAAGGVACLRAHVARFSNGADHEHRRGLAITELAPIDPATIGRRAEKRAATALAAAAGRPVDLMAQVARAVPVGVLAEALGVTRQIVDDVALVARGYHPGTDAGPAADDAVGRLVEAFGGTPDLATANRIGLLVQACDATAGLIGNAALALLRWPHPAPTDAVVAETLRYDPPVRATRRVCLAAAHVGDTHVAAGALVSLDIATANRDPQVFADPHRFDPARPQRDRHLTFGEGLRPCPGRDLAFAIAVGVVQAVRGYRLIDADTAADPSASLRVPAQLWLRQL